MIHKEFFGLLFLGFVAWIFMAGTPKDRIENACAPVAWVGNGTTSLASLVLPNEQVKVQGWFDSVEYGCRYVTWRLFYQKAYNQWLSSQGTSASGGPAPVAAPVPAASSASAASTPVAASAVAASTSGASAVGALK